MWKTYYVYMVTNPAHTTIYTGVTNNLKRRVHEHKSKEIPGFTKQYDAIKLVYWEKFDSPSVAIAREKQIKSGSRLKKEALIDNFNKRWEDLFSKI